MSDDHRYAILLLGLFLNEANWLRKLLVKAVFGIAEGPEPDGQANFGLTALLATTLAGKIHEGWERIANGRLGKILGGVGMSPQLAGLRGEITDALKGKTFLHIRNNVAFHYPERKFEFRKIDDHLDGHCDLHGPRRLPGRRVLSGLEPCWDRAPSGIERGFRLSRSPENGVGRNHPYHRALLLICE